MAEDGHGFGELEGNNFIAKNEIYGLKYTGSSFRLFLARKLD